MEGVRTGSSRFAAREILLLAIAVGASFLFINHENLYLTNRFRLSDVRIESYLLATAILYLFLRLVVIALEMRPSRVRPGLVQCPECGRWLDDPTAAGLEAHRRIELTPKPSTKEVVSAVALRRAVDAARLGDLAPPTQPGVDRNPALPMPTNLTGQDLLDALKDPEYLERIRHSPKAPTDPRLKR